MNKIITNVVDKALYIPIDCIQNNEEMAYVFTSRTRRQVLVGASNDNEIIIKAGLEEGEEVYLIPPENAESYRVEKLSKEVLAKFNLTKDKK